ncbi:hypothetical protein [Halorubrum lacusprofundi]|jgi:hypothetical protein|uniref:hypothetical protein n=1 Tax=Halorubrum lacusprofundi TaxID=2247 RepID=UPI000B5A97A0|nr:hypothetical protein [Halorubrum lacusprofundi]MCG1008250.1 hypothetical protein [Halorubrum lacusprofundi]
MSEPETPQRDEQPLDDTGHRASGGNDALNADDTHVARGVDENTHVKGPEHDAKAVYQQPDGTPKATGRTLVESVATVRIDCTNAPNDRVMIHIEHPNHDRGVRCFSRSPEASSIASVIRSHLRTEIDAELARVEVIDTVGLGLTEAALLPRRSTISSPDTSAPVVEVTGA